MIPRDRSPVLHFIGSQWGVPLLWELDKPRSVAGIGWDELQEALGGPLSQVSQALKDARALGLVKTWTMPENKRRRSRRRVLKLVAELEGLGAADETEAKVLTADDLLKITKSISPETARSLRAWREKR